MALVCSLYCDYYLEKEPSHCFVTTDEFDKPSGYILCAKSFDKYVLEFEPYLKKAKKLSFVDYVAQKYLQKAVADVAKEYPAHLHVDVLPSFQGRGNGRALITTLLAHLRGEGVKGVHLVVSQSNTGAIAFYERLGFARQKRIFKTAYVYAISL